ncbi:MAG: T9SS type A sorting domain-containing protein [Bacteroidota bacterium]
MKTLVKAILFCSVFYPINLKGQGYLMLAGGGGESAGGWSDLPYAWVVNHSANKKVAVISVNDETDWVPNYFKSFGAKWTKNFKIDSKSLANSQWLYDSLVTYNAIFLKGGDQSKYYEYYKGTKTQQALQYVYNNGGVLAGTSAGAMILSPIVYTAQVASVDPSTALMSAYSPQITLANDFVNTIQGNFIFDTHVAERSRMGRIPAFMASWYKLTGQIAIGVGIDDHTAICISPNGSAVIYGTGAVGIYRVPNTSNPFDTQVSMLKSNYIELAQLLHGTTINLNTFEVSGYSNTINPLVNEINSRIAVFFSGTDYPSDDACAYFVNQAGGSADPILIVTGTDQSRANSLKSTFTAKGAAKVDIIQGLTANSSNTEHQALINAAKKFVFVSNDRVEFFSYLNAVGNGQLLKNKLKASESISFFVGDNARFAGASIVNNYTTSGASYNGQLEFSSGIGLLENLCIIPNAFINSQYYENSVTGVSYAMLHDKLKYGLLITGSTFACYSYDSQQKSYFKNLFGSYPLVFLRNSGTKGAFANQGPYSQSRNIAGFEKIMLRFVGNADTVVVGTNVPTNTAEMLNPVSSINIYPNPAMDFINIEVSEPSHIEIFDITGKKMVEAHVDKISTISISNLPEGIYLVRMASRQNKNIATRKILKVSKN